MKKTLKTGSQAQPAAEEGLRDRKRRETRQRVAEAGRRLFLAKGYEATTLDAIAEEAGISRRAFFSYFKSKDDIIIFWQEADLADFYAELLKVSPDVPPLDAVRDAMVARIARYTTEQMTVVDNLMRSSPALIARKQAHYGEMEQALYRTLCEVWRQPERRPALQMVAMVSIGAQRIALQAWREQTGPKKPPAKFLRDAFENLKAELQ